MTESNDLCSNSVSSHNEMSDAASLDAAPLELTVTTSITSLTPTSSSAASIVSSSSSIAGITVIKSDDCSILDVGAMIETRSSFISPKSETENESEHRYHSKQTKLSPVSDSSSSSLNAILNSDNEIKAGSRFLSFADFERVFEDWKASNYHPFRVASSETLRLPDGSTNAVFKYRYIVFHCAHYGAPRMRGVGKRPNQNYMPCGCKAMLRLNYSWSENALRVTTLNEDHIGHEATEDAYYKFAAKAKQRQSSSSPPAVHVGVSPSPGRVITSTGKRPRSESPYTTSPTQLHQAKFIKNGHHQTEAPLNLSKHGLAGGGVVGQNPPASTKRSVSMDGVAPSPALSVLMFNHQQQHQQQHAYHELLRLLSVNGAGGGVGGGGLVTALGANVRDCRNESERHRLITPIMQTLTQHLAAARGFEFDDKLRDLKAVLKKWQLIPTPTPPQPISTTGNNNFVNRSSSAAAAAAAMMVQAMSAGAGTGFVMTNGNGSANANGLLSNGR